MRVEDFLRGSARVYPEKVALVDGTERRTYAQLDEATGRLACALSGAGVRRHDRVVVLADSSIDAVVSIFGALRAGAIFSVLNPTTKTEKLAYILNHCRPTAFITQARLLPTAAAAIRGSESVRRTFVAGAAAKEEVRDCMRLEEALEAAVPEAPEHGGIDLDLAAIIYTSGSTGLPKGVTMTHRNIVAAATSITTYLENTREDVILDALPLSFDYGLYQVLMAFLFGGTVVLERSFAFPYLVLQKLTSERVTGFPIVPTMAALILQMKDLRPGSFPHLRYITNTAASLPPAHIEQLQRLFPETRIYSMYGLTECKRCTYLPPDQLKIRPASVGKAIPNTEVYIVDEKGERLPPGQTGELVVRGAHVMQGYWEDPVATDKVLKPGLHPWEKVLHTGDLFRADEEGFLYFVGRRDDFIKTRGEKVSPVEIERTLHAMPGVREAAVVGVPDPILGQAIKAVIVPADGVSLTEKDVLRHCAAHLEDFMLPKQVEFRGELPKTDSGKILRRGLNLDPGRTGSPTAPGVAGRAAPSPAAAEDAAGTAAARLEPSVLRIDAARVSQVITETIRSQVLETLGRRGVVVGLSGGVDSSVVAALCARALGPERVLGLLLPEPEGNADSLRLGRLVAGSLGVKVLEEDIGPLLQAAGCYERRDACIRGNLPEYGPGFQCKLVLRRSAGDSGYNVYGLVVRTPNGTESRIRLSGEALLGIVAATSLKQRTRMLMEYYHAERLHYAVAGTPNRLEYDQGFFVKFGDGAADLKPIAHLYKSQVYQLAEHLGIPEEVRRRQPSADTYPLAQSQEEFYFGLPYEKLDLCLYALNHGIPAEGAAPAVGLSAAEVGRIYADIESKRKATFYQHAPPLLAEEILEVG